MRIGEALVLVAVVVLGTVHIPRGSRHSVKRVVQPVAPDVAPAVTYVAGTAVEGDEAVPSDGPIRPQLVIRPWWKEVWATELLENNPFPHGQVPDLETRAQFFRTNFARIPQDKIGMFFDGLCISDRAALVTQIIEDVLCSQFTVSCAQFPSQLQRVRHLIHGIQAGICKEEDDEASADLGLDAVLRRSERLDSYALDNMPLHYAFAVDGILRHLTTKPKLQGSRGCRYGKIACMILATCEASVRRTVHSIPISAKDLADVLLSLAQYHPALFNDPNLRDIVLHLPATPQTDRIFFLLLRHRSPSATKVDRRLLANLAFRTTHGGYLKALRIEKRCRWLPLYRRRHTDTVIVYGADRGLDLLLGHLPDFVTLRDQIVVDLAAHTDPPPKNLLRATRAFTGNGAAYLSDADLFKGSNLKRLRAHAKETPYLDDAAMERALRRIRNYRPCS